MKLLLVTGAGASRNLGLEAPMPLMTDWADALCKALDHQEEGLANSCHLSPGMKGPEFEKNLGELLTWDKMRYLEERFELLGGPHAGSRSNEAVGIRNRIGTRMEVVLETIKRTLYDQFGQMRIDDKRATSAFGGLLRELGEPQLTVATTNYDRSADTALEALGHGVETGFVSIPNRTPTLQPIGLIERRDSRTPVIHLHGAVGWYEQGGSVRKHPADQKFNPTLGNPVVLYPDPEKDPANEALVSELWREFEIAIEEAEAVLVIGHSLHDPALVRSLKRATDERPVVISHLESTDPQEIEERVPGSQPIELEFGPETVVRLDELRELLGLSEAPVP